MGAARIRSDLSRSTFAEFIWRDSSALPTCWFDARKKNLRRQGVFEYLALGWQLEPQQPGVAGANGRRKGRVSVNFLPDLKRVEHRLRAGQVRHERQELCHPDTNRLQSIVFSHDMAARASVP